MRRELSEYIILGEELLRSVEGLSNSDLDGLYRADIAMRAEAWASSIRFWLDANLPAEIGLFRSDTDIGVDLAKEIIEAFLDTRLFALRQLLLLPDERFTTARPSVASPN